ncbi:Canalicular multispecific organic anion transporter 1 [Coemansia sp. RSA 2131]|nr:Canalicular multispecific organic anion transporter 1 [Coemansia sp. RSA 2131]
MAAKYIIALYVLDFALVFSTQAECTAEHTAFMVAALVLAMHSLINHKGSGTKHKIERLEKSSRTRVTPRIYSNLQNLVRDIRGIKFYAWDNAFRNARVPMDDDDFMPPLFWRITSLLVDLVGSAISQIASAIAIMSAIQSSVVGCIGSGKSSLMSALCGEMPIVSGQGRLSGRIGFVDQKPKVLNTTFRENVLMGNEYEEKWFNQVIYACALTQDLEQMENGDQTEVGYGGVNLSGGQKTRLALARALYLKADVYIFDDLLSAVDAHVERHIIENVLMAGGIIGSKTRILVTHAEHVIPLSDKVVTLTDGQVQVVNQTPVQLSGDSISKNAAQSGDAVVETQDLADIPEPFVIHPDYDDPPLRWTSFQKYIALSGYGTVAAVAAIQL